MTTLNQLQLLYQQLDNLNKEIDNFIEDEEYDFALEKIKLKDSLIKNLANAKKTADISPEEMLVFEEKNREISKKNFELIEKLKLVHQDLASKRVDNKKKIKLKNAYSVENTTNSSVYIDMEE